MSDFATTVPGARGCGSSRESGGIYLSRGLSPDGVPIWNFLVDPATPWQGEKFQGVHLAPASMTDNWPEDSVLLLDMVSKEDYPTVPDFVEECLLPNEGIITGGGMKPISEIEVGDRVLTHRGRFQPVTSLHRRHYNGEMVHLKMYGCNQGLKLTPGHPVLCFQDGKPGFVAAGDILVGDRVCFPILTECEDKASVGGGYQLRRKAVYGMVPRAGALALREEAKQNGLLSGNELKLLPLLQRVAEIERVQYGQCWDLLGDLYEYSSGLTKALRRLVDRGLVDCLCHGEYQITGLGRAELQKPHKSYAELGAPHGLDRHQVAKVLGRADEAEPGYSSVREIRVQLPVNEALMILSGYYLAEGSVADTCQRYKDIEYYSVTEFSFGKGKKEKEYAETVVDAAEILGFHATLSWKKDCYHVLVYSRTLAHFLVDTFGKGARHKRIPEWILHLPANKLMLLYQTYMDGDGYRRKGEEVGATASPHLAEGIALIAGKLGLTASIRLVSQHSFGKKYDIFRVGISSKGAVRIRLEDGYQTMYVRSAERVLYNGPVFNLTVAEDESYCTTRCAVHNCRRMGLSRRISSGFDFSALGGKTVYLGLIHWRATVTWSPADAYPVPEYVHCLKKEVSGHLGECLYHLWPLAVRYHAEDIVNPASLDHARIVRPLMEYAPYGVMERGQEVHVDEFPKEYLGPGLFMIMPISHLEAVDYVPMGTDLEESGLPHVVTGW